MKFTKGFMKDFYPLIKKPKVYGKLGVSKYRNIYED